MRVLAACLKACPDTNLTCTNLTCTNLTCTNLTCTNLTCTNRTYTSPTCTNRTCGNLYEPDFYEDESLNRLLAGPGGGIVAVLGGDFQASLVHQNLNGAVGVAGAGLGRVSQGVLVAGLGGDLGVGVFHGIAGEF
jgi:hypothetical protein